VRVRTARGRKSSSTRWLQRQLNDPYVAEAQRQGYRSRAAFKLIQIDEKGHFLRPGARVVDLGAAPGGWTQVAVARVLSGRGEERVVAADVLPMEPVTGAEVVQLDMLVADAPDRVAAALGGPADVVLSDMAAPTTGHRATDHMRTLALAEAAADFACRVLAPGGTLVVKVFQGGAQGTLLTRLKREFARVRHVKPAASRDESPETYLVATGFRGGAGDAQV
jgi:23S rRNA (uridine2552-2'-O)-methyltransferase